MGDRVYFVLDDAQPYVRIARKLGVLSSWKLVVQIENDSNMHFIEVQWTDGTTNQTVGTLRRGRRPRSPGRCRGVAGR